MLPNYMSKVAALIGMYGLPSLRGVPAAPIFATPVGPRKSKRANQRRVLMTRERLAQKLAFEHSVNDRRKDDLPAKYKHAFARNNNLFRS